MKKKTVFNKIKYGLLQIFPKEHPNFSVDNENMIITYGKIFNDGRYIYGQIEINKDMSVYMWIFKSRDDRDVPILDHTWNSVDDLLRDKDIDHCIEMLLINNDEEKEEN